MRVIIAYSRLVLYHYLKQLRVPKQIDLPWEHEKGMLTVWFLIPKFAGELGWFALTCKSVRAYIEKELRAIDR
jgi:hypothetical protein